MLYACLDKVKSLMGLWGDTEHSVFADNQEGCGVQLRYPQQEVGVGGVPL